MELEEFIATTLFSIKKGIRDANIKIAEDDGGKLGTNVSCQYEISAGGKGIKFDVAVTVSNEKGSKGGGKVKIAVVDIGGGINSLSREEYVSRISFEVNPFNSVN